MLQRPATDQWNHVEPSGPDPQAQPPEDHRQEDKHDIQHDKDEDVLGHVSDETTARPVLESDPKGE
jgi:hypothetical protein